MTDSAVSAVSLHTIYHEHHGWLYRRLRRTLGFADAEDLANDTFLRVFTAAPVAELREPRAYLTTVARNLQLNHYRRKSLEQAYLDALAAVPEPLASSPEERALILEAIDEIDTMLQGLPTAVRAAFLLAQLEGLGYAEIAGRLGVSERSVKRYVAQALAQCVLLAA
ncbi:sigma-70 family RNA polymerase sigma factor [Nevskia sp.]|uniref:sigma-70 family RNA polymerase sigma factor n=1 Tax=Nevskia sp. TaxID=1929292 RepID=UPI0025E33DDB|nr:sigma-70 family RNA polymerase sigma factor [Nevskia sp.]